jgi:hypothetical protein
MKIFLLLCAIAFVLVIGVMNVSDRELGTFNLWTAAMFSGSVLLGRRDPLAQVHHRRVAPRGGRWLTSYAMIVSVAALIVSGYLGVGHDRLQAVELLTGRDTSPSQSRRSLRRSIRKDDLPEVRSAQGRREERSTTSPTVTIIAVDCVFEPPGRRSGRDDALECGTRHDRADHRRDLRTSETSDVSPTNAGPPSIANTGLFICPLADLFNVHERSPYIYPAPDQQHEPHHDIRDDHRIGSS